MSVISQHQKPYVQRFNHDFSVKFRLVVYGIVFLVFVSGFWGGGGFMN